MIDIGARFRGHVSRSIAFFAIAFAFAAVAGPASAQVVRQVTDAKADSVRVAATDDSGTDIFVASSADPFGTNPSHAFQIFRYVAASGAGVQVTSFRDGVSDAIVNLSVSDDGQWLAFLSRGNLTGQNHDRSPELFTMARDGSSVVQVTNDPGPNAGIVSVLAMAGAGAKVAFACSSDLTGGNPDHAQQIFLVNRDGTGLTQLTTFDDAEETYLAVSDDATKIAFASDADPLGTNADGNYDLFAINGDGSGLRQLTATTGADVYEDSIVWVQLAGNGSRIAFQSNRDLLGTNADLLAEVFDVDWDGTNLRQLTAATTTEAIFPAITDDGLTVYYSSNQNPLGSQLWKVQADGTGRVQVAGTTLYGGNLVVSGSGNRLAFWNFGPLDIIDTTGSNLRTLLTEVGRKADGAAITPNGSIVLFTSNANLTGSNPDGSPELFQCHNDGTAIAQISNNVDVYEPSIGNNNTTIVFASGSNPTGGNPSFAQQIFRINVNGTGIQQLTTATNGFCIAPVISANDSVVVFTSTANLTGQNADLSGEIFRVGPTGTGLLQLSHGTGGSSYYSYYPRVDATGTWVVFSGNDNIDGGNPDHSFEVWRIRATGTNLQRITTDPYYGSGGPDISADGTKIAYDGTADPLGTNADHNFEIFLYDTTTGITRQLTNKTEGNSAEARFSPDGLFVYFISDERLLEDHHRTGHELYRVSIATGLIERVDGLGLGLPPGQPDTGGSVFAVGPGGRVAFTHPSDRTGNNPDKNPELFLIDPSTAAKIRMSSGAAPTVVSWDAESGPVRYDVIRGDLQNVHLVGGTVDLGAVSCLEDDSPDVDTVGNEDAATPTSGQAFFFLYRGSQGVDAGPGSYGSGSNAMPRVAGVGACLP